jgi:hypothetical protein
LRPPLVSRIGPAPVIPITFRATAANPGLTDIARIVMNLAGVVVASTFLAADALVVPVAGAGAEAARFVQVIEGVGRIGLGVYIAFCWIEIIKAGLRLRRPLEA